MTDGRTDGRFIDTLFLCLGYKRTFRRFSCNDLNPKLAVRNVTVRVFERYIV